MAEWINPKYADMRRAEAARKARGDADPRPGPRVHPPAHQVTVT